MFSGALVARRSLSKGCSATPGALWTGNACQEMRWRITENVEFSVPVADDRVRFALKLVVRLGGEPQYVKRVR
jgi:hypothetical protein